MQKHGHLFIRPIGFALSLFIIILSLAGCLNMASTGAQAVYNQYSLQQTLTDERISLQAFQTLYHNTKAFADTHITITTYHGEVLLAGQAPTLWQKQSAAKLIEAIPDVVMVHNQISIATPASALTRLSDAWITTKVKAKLITSQETDGTAIKVFTENGVVYLMGTVLPDEAHVATALANDTEGVLRVVNLFLYVRISRNDPTEPIVNQHSQPTSRAKA